MRTIALTLAVLIGIPAAARAQATVDVRVNLPVVLPPLVVVSPGVRVVPDVDDEVFFSGGYYWVRRDAYWYRSREHRGGWVLVPARGVPPRLASLPPGKYRHWKAEKEAAKRERKAARGHDRGHGNGHGNGKGHVRGHGRD